MFQPKGAILAARVLRLSIGSWPLAEFQVDDVAADPAHTRLVQALDFRPRDILGHHRDAAQPLGIQLDRVEHGIIAGAIDAGLRENPTGQAKRIEHMTKVAWQCVGGCVEPVRRERVAVPWAEHVGVAIACVRRRRSRDRRENRRLMYLGGADPLYPAHNWAFRAKGSPSPGRQFERTFSDDFRAGVGAGRPNRQGGGDRLVPTYKCRISKGLEKNGSYL